LNKAIRIFLRFVYEKVTKTLEYCIPDSFISPFLPVAGTRERKLMGQIMPFLKKWHYF